MTVRRENSTTTGTVIVPRMDGFDIVGSSPEEFAARIAVDLERLGPIVKNSGARAE